MNKCKKCDVDLDKHRAHLGYTECLECSEVEAYSAHTVYPHKTGGYVQPVSKTTSNNLKRMDRRSTGNTRYAGGIYSDNSWDRWLDEYYNPKPVSINYRGHKDKLFKRDFAGEIMNKYKSLKLVDYGFVYHGDGSFPQDDLTWFLLKK